MNRYAIRILLCLCSFQSGDLVVAENYPYEPAIVELEGVLEKELWSGRPNYGEFPKTDVNLTVHVLILKQPITAGTSDTLSELNDSTVANVSKVQVVFLDGFPESTTKFIGKTVVLNGSLSKQITGYHFYPIMFWVSSKE